MSEWKVSHTYASGEIFYQVYRTLREGEPDHSGNREIRASFGTETEAEQLAAELNLQEAFCGTNQ